MKNNLLVILLLSISLSGFSQIRKTGASYLGAKYSSFNHGKTIGVKYESFFRTNLSFIVSGSYENSEVELTNYNTYLAAIGINKSFSVLEDVYVNVPLLFHGGMTDIKNEYHKAKKNTVFSLSFTPNVEYFLLDKISLFVGFSTYLDFNYDFRKSHTSIDVGLNYIL